MLDIVQRLFQLHACVRTIRRHELIRLQKPTLMCHWRLMKFVGSVVPVSQLAKGESVRVSRVGCSVASSASVGLKEILVRIK